MKRRRKPSEQPHSLRNGSSRAAWQACLMLGGRIQGATLPCRRPPKGTQACGLVSCRLVGQSAGGTHSEVLWASFPEAGGQENIVNYVVWGDRNARNHVIYVVLLLGTSKSIRFGCISGIENAAKPCFWRPGGSQSMYFTMVSCLQNRSFRGLQARSHVGLGNFCSRIAPQGPPGDLRRLPGGPRGRQEGPKGAPPRALKPRILRGFAACVVTKVS